MPESAQASAEDKALHPPEPGTAEVSSDKPPMHGDAMEGIISEIGKCGPFMVYLFFISLPFAAGCAFCYLVQMFITLAPRFFCQNDYVSNYYHSYLRDRMFWIAPLSDQCHMYNVTWTILTFTSTSWTQRTIIISRWSLGWGGVQTYSVTDIEIWSITYSYTTFSFLPATGRVRLNTMTCSVYEYITKEIPYPTLVTDLHWMCAKAHYPTTVEKMFFAGAIAGAFIFGLIGDFFGRVPALVLSNLVGLAGGMTTSLSDSKWSMAGYRLLEGLSYDTSFMMMYIIGLEYCAIPRRTLFVNMLVAIWYCGCVIALPYIALLIKNWKTLMYVIAAPMGFAALAILIVPESLRWLSCRGYIDKATITMKRIAKCNSVEVPDDKASDLIMVSESIPHNETFITLLTIPPLVLMLLLKTIVYFCCTLPYFVLLRLTLNPEADFFQEFALLAAIEIPACMVVALLLDRVGRMIFTSVSLLICGVACIIAMTFTANQEDIILSIVARFSCVMAWRAVTQWVCELLPTGARAGGSAFVHISGYLGAILTFSVLKSRDIYDGMSHLIIGITAFIGAGLALLLPETKGMPLPQSMADAKGLKEMKHPLNFGVAPSQIR